MKPVGPLLDASDRRGEAWTKIKLHYEARLASLRVANDNPKLTDAQTAILRGRIAECKAVLNLDKELPEHNPDNPLENF